jgi:hypothetical protein
METENLPIPTYRQGSFPKQVEDQPSWYKISVTRDAFPKIILEIENYFHQRDGMKWNMLYTYGGYVCSPISGVVLGSRRPLRKEIPRRRTSTSRRCSLQYRRRGAVTCFEPISSRNTLYNYL